MSSEDMPRSVAKRLGYAMKRVQHALRTSVDQALRVMELNAPQYGVLCALEAEAGLSNARLARAAFVTAQTMQGMLANLERNGLLERHPDPDNARILRTILTPLGQARLAEAHELVADVESVLTKTGGAEEADRLALSLTACAENLQAFRAAQE
jgi:DNA-binding MarR family transcriptional regulator